MSRPENFKQETPIDQLAVIYGSLKGNLDNFKDGIIDASKLAERTKKFEENMDKLVPFLVKGSW